MPKDHSIKIKLQTSQNHKKLKTKFLIKYYKSNHHIYNLIMKLSVKELIKNLKHFSNLY